MKHFRRSLAAAALLAAITAPAALADTGQGSKLGQGQTVPPPFGSGEFVTYEQQCQFITGGQYPFTFYANLPEAGPRGVPQPTTVANQAECAQALKLFHLHQNGKFRNG